MKNLIAVGIGIFVFAFAVIGGYEAYKEHKASLLPSMLVADGNILRVGVKESLRTVRSSGSPAKQLYWQLTIAYEYSVEGHNYVGTRYSHSGQPSSVNAEVIWEIASKYTAGDAVEVFYRVSDPTYAVLVNRTM